jgi:hypothetical protein
MRVIHCRFSWFGPKPFADDACITVLPNDLNVVDFKFLSHFLKDKDHNGPGPVGTISPTIPEITQIIRAIMNDLIHPKLYRDFSARSHTIPPLTAAKKPWPKMK